VVVDGPAEAGAGELLRQGPKRRELLVEGLRRAAGGREPEVGERPAVDEAERLDLAPQSRIALAHPPNPLVMERVVLGAQEHVEAEHALGERRDGETAKAMCSTASAGSRIRIIRSSFSGTVDRILARPDHRRQMRTTLLAAAALAGFALAAAGSARPANPVLVANVGYHNRFTISLRFPNGKLVQTLPAGTYSIVVHDYSRLHNFALGSQTENRRIFTGGIRGIGTKTYTVTLTPGAYAHACSAHFRTMNGTFVVTESNETTTTTTSTEPTTTGG
jgi:hypothetical protein